MGAGRAWDVERPAGRREHGRQESRGGRAQAGREPGRGCRGHKAGAAGCRPGSMGGHMQWGIGWPHEVTAHSRGGKVQGTHSRSAIGQAGHSARTGTCRRPEKGGQFCSISRALWWRLCMRRMYKMSCSYGRIVDKFGPYSRQYAAFSGDVFGRFYMQNELQ